MKNLIMFIIMVFGYHNFLYANAPQTCGKNIKTGIIVCYDLKNYNKNPKISLEFGNGLDDENPLYDNWEIKYNLKAILKYDLVIKNNGKIKFSQKFQDISSINEEYELYNAVVGFNNRLAGDLIVKYGLLPEDYHYTYSSELNKFIKKYNNLDENNLEIKKSEYIINTLTPLLEPEKLQLKKIEDKRNIILGDDFNNYINSLKEKDNQEKEESKLRLKELSVIAEKISYITTDINKISEQQEELYKIIKNKEENSIIQLRGILKRKSKEEKKYEDLQKQKETKQEELKEFHSKYDINEYDRLMRSQENPENYEQSLDLKKCSLTTCYESQYYTYKHIDSCYKKVIDDESKLEMLHNIDNIYIKQHKKVQFIIKTIEENKSNISNAHQQIESKKIKKELEKELS